ncbi:hypothetical protein BJX68DRAFT_105559 [Aspergillus pseudodeflectus]|uniref:Uncharacterized protein n=1 Tax=Aspergillus pseudodeflectus TaxID=176178 RepID=A0ABR4K6G2_9EURO
MGIASPPTAVAALTLTLALTVLTTAQTCYNPDRTISSNAVPCSSDDDTFCCGSDAICLSNGYCLSVTVQPYSLYRGSCTDSGWGDFCAYYCVNFLTGTNALITSVGTNDDGRAIYCCGYQSANQTIDECANGDAPFVLEDGEMVFGRAALADASEDSSSSSTTSTSPTATGTDASTEPSTCSNNDVAIGAGVGVPLGMLALSAVAWALLERRRRVKTVTGVGIGSGAERGHAHVLEVFVPPQRKAGPTELDQQTASSSPDTLIHGREVVELMGSERGATST